MMYITSYIALRNRASRTYKVLTFPYSRHCPCTTMGEIERFKSLKQYCELSTCMGIPDCYFEKRVQGKIFWAIIVIVGLIITTGQTYSTIHQFRGEDPYKTTVSGSSESGIPFPQVTVCNFNRAKQSLIEENNLDPHILIYMFQLFPTLYDFPLWMMDGGNGSYIQKYVELWKNYTISGGEQDYSVLIKTYAHNARDTFIDISAGGRLMNYQNAKSVLTVYGACWKLDPDYNQSLPGENV